MTSSYPLDYPACNGKPDSQAQHDTTTSSNSELDVTGLDGTSAQDNNDESRSTENAPKCSSPNLEDENQSEMPSQATDNTVRAPAPMNLAISPIAPQPNNSNKLMRPWVSPQKSTGSTPATSQNTRTRLHTPGSAFTVVTQPRDSGYNSIAASFQQTPTSDQSSDDVRWSRRWNGSYPSPSWPYTSDPRRDHTGVQTLLHGPTYAAPIQMLPNHDALFMGGMQTLAYPQLPHSRFTSPHMAAIAPAAHAPPGGHDLSVRRRPAMSDTSATQPPTQPDTDANNKTNSGDFNHVTPATIKPDPDADKENTDAATAPHHSAKHKERHNTCGRRFKFPDATRRLMEAWYQTNIRHPYPSTEQLEEFAKHGNATYQQVVKWFHNTRNRNHNTLKHNKSMNPKTLRKLMKAKESIDKTLARHTQHALAASAADAAALAAAGSLPDTSQTQYTHARPVLGSLQHTPSHNSGSTAALYPQPTQSRNQADMAALPSYAKAEVPYIVQPMLTPLYQPIAQPNNSVDARLFPQPLQPIASDGRATSFDTHAGPSIHPAYAATHVINQAYPFGSAVNMSSLPQLSAGGVPPLDVTAQYRPIIRVGRAYSPASHLRHLTAAAAADQYLAASQHAPPTAATQHVIHTTPARRDVTVGDDTEDESSAAAAPARFSQSALHTLKAWYKQHRQAPYPTRIEKQELAQQTGLSYAQVSNWLTNRRRRHKQNDDE